MYINNIYNNFVRLNLINHLVGFIPCQICLYFSKRNHVRAVCVRECEELLKCVQRSRDSWLDFAGGSRLQAAKLKHMCQACQKLKRCGSCSL